jgi:hypothetical protein
MTTLKVGIAKVWFTSMESFAKVLSDRNRALLALIAETQPGSLAELAALSWRAESNLSRTLKTMERYGLVQLRKGQGGTVAPRNRIRGSRWPSLWSHGGNDSQTTPKASLRGVDGSGERDGSLQWGMACPA